METKLVSQVSTGDGQRADVIVIELTCGVLEASHLW
jgi:hypothetical protein